MVVRVVPFYAKGASKGNKLYVREGCSLLCKNKGKRNKLYEKRHMLNFTMLVHFEDHGVNQRPHVDLTGTHSFVEATVLVGIKENEVGGAVVEFVPVQMMALLSGLTGSPECSANQDVNGTFFAGNIHYRIATATLVILHSFVKIGLADLPFSVSDVAVRIGIVRFTAN